MKTTYTSFLVYFILTINLNAQQIEWQNTIGGTGGDFIESIIQTTDNGYLVGGSSWSNTSGDKTEDCIGGWDYWIVKLDSTGAVMWDNTIGGSGDDRLRDVIQTTDGGYLVGGLSHSNISGDKTEDCKGVNTYWVLKLDSLGTIQWQKTFGGDLRDELEKVLQTADGGYLLGGTSNSNDTLDKAEPCYSPFIDDFWIIKIDSIGNMEWQNTIGGTGYDHLSSMRLTPDGGFVIGSNSNSPISPDKSENPVGPNNMADYWIVKLDSVGNIMWDNTIGGDTIDICWDIVVTSDGGIFCGGFSLSGSSGDKSEPVTGKSDYWIVKLDSSGNLLWENTIGGLGSGGANGEEELFAVGESSDGGLLICGLSYSNVSVDKNEPSQGSSDIWVLKLDSQGHIEWQNTIGGSDDDDGKVLFPTKDNGCIIGASSFSDISGDKTEDKIGSMDFWVVKLTSQYNLISGNAFADLNLNNIQDATETAISNLKIVEASTGKFSFTNNQGQFELAVSDSGNFEVSPVSFPYYYIANPLVHNSYFSSILDTSSQNDFAIQPNGLYNDLCIDITPYFGIRAGGVAMYQVDYVNQGTTIQNAGLIFYPDTVLSFLNSDPVPDSVFPDSIVYQLGNLEPYQNGSILIYLSVDTTLNIGHPVRSDVTILPIAGDINPSCNSDSSIVAIIGSFDPNDIAVNRSSIFNTELATPPLLEYVIRFQNTGNDTAFYVRIEDILPSQLQLSEFEMLSSSHPCSSVYDYYDNRMKFTFNNILLPDSNTNELMSHGFVKFRIKPLTTLQIGDSILNGAGIFFDYNPPVITNNALTTIVLSTSGIPEYSSNNILIYPNPASGKTVTINLGTVINNKSFSVYDTRGKLILRRKFSDSENLKSFELNIENLQQGIYIIKTEGKNPGIGKFVKL